MIRLANKKKQHFVPQFYLKKFSDNNGFLNVYNIPKDKTINHAHFSSQCKSDYYYGDDLVWENTLQSFESGWGAAFNSILNGDFSDSVIKEMKSFAVFQYQRSKCNNDFKIDERTEVAKKIFETYCENKEWDFSDEAIEKAVKDYTDDSLGSVPQFSLEMASDLSDVIDDLSALVITYNTKNELITSDNPVILINRFCEGTTGFACLGLIIFFPISPKKLVVFYDSKIYPKFSDKKNITINNENEVLNLNAFQLISAENIVLYKDSLKFIDFHKAFSTRNRNLAIEKAHMLGAKEQRLIINNIKPTIFECSLSFAVMCKEAESILYPCREAVPRKYEKGWEDKLINKSTIMPEIQKLTKVRITQTQKSTKKACLAMLKFAQKYWRS